MWYNDIIHFVSKIVIYNIIYLHNISYRKAVKVILYSIVLLSILKSFAKQTLLSVSLKSLKTVE